MAQLNTMPKEFEDAISIIESVKEKAERVEISLHQSKRLSKRFENVGRAVKQWKDSASNVENGDDKVNVPSHDNIAFAQLLTVLKKGELLVTKCMDIGWLSTVLERPVHQEEFEEINKDLSLCTTSLNLAPEEQSGQMLLDGDEETLAADAKLDQTDLLAKLEAKKSTTIYHSVAEADLENLTSTVNQIFGTARMIYDTNGKPNLTMTEEDGTELPSYLKIRPDVFRDEKFEGRGDYGIVKKANWWGCIVCVKDFPWCGGYTEEWNDEVVMMIRYRHPRVSQLMGFCLESKKAVTEFMLGGDIREFIDLRLREAERLSPQGGPFSHSESMDMMRQIANAMNYLHQNNHMHGDRVLTMNVVVKESRNRSLDVKIADMGVPQERLVKWRADLDIPYPGELRRESIRWTAPEVYAPVLGKEVLHYSAMSDVYSYGVLCSEILTGNYPFGHITDPAEVRSRVLAGERPQLPDNLDTELERLIRNCWHVDRTLRPTAKEICETLEKLMFPVRTVMPHVAENTETQNPRMDNDSDSGSDFPAPEPPCTDSDETGEQGQSQLTSSEPKVDLPFYLQIPKSELKKTKRLGEGSFAVVYEAEWLGSKCAVKLLTSARTKTHTSALQNEVRILMTLRHPNIVQLMGFSEDINSIVMELMVEELPALYERCLSTPGHQGSPFDYATSLSIIKQIASGMTHLHSQNILHRDLKGGNVLVHDHGDHVEAKIADFGMSQFTHGQSKINTGSGFWRPPELFRAIKQGVPFEYTTKSDVYSFAMTCYEVLTGKAPFEDDKRYTRMKDIIEMLENWSDAGGWRTPRPVLSYDQGFNVELLHLIEDCWNDVPDVRPSFYDIHERLERLPLE